MSGVEVELHLEERDEGDPGHDIRRRELGRGDRAGPLDQPGQARPLRRVRRGVDVRQPIVEPAVAERGGVDRVAARIPARPRRRVRDSFAAASPDDGWRRSSRAGAGRHGPGRADRRSDPRLRRRPARGHTRPIGSLRASA